MTSDELLLATLARHTCRTGEARRLRESLGISCRDAARALGIDVSVLSRYERGLTVPTRGTNAIAYGRLIASWLRASEALLA